MGGTDCPHGLAVPATVGTFGSGRGVRGVHDGLAVGPHRTVVMAKRIVAWDGAIVARAVTWRTNRSDWTTTSLTKRQVKVWVLTTAVDSTGRILVPWRTVSGPGPRGASWRRT